MLFSYPEKDKTCFSFTKESEYLPMLRHLEVQEHLYGLWPATGYRQLEGTLSMLVVHWLPAMRSSAYE